MSPAFRDALAMRKLHAMRERSAKAQRERAKGDCDCPLCVAGRTGEHPIKALLESLGAVEVDLDSTPLAMPHKPGGKAH